MSTKTGTFPTAPASDDPPPDEAVSDTASEHHHALDAAPSAAVSTPLASSSEVSARGISRLPVRQGARWLLVIASMLLVGWLLWRTWAVLLPFQIGLVVAYLVLPIVNALERYLPRWAAILVVYLGGMLLFVGFFAYVVPPLVNQVNRFIATIPSMTEIEGYFNNLIDQYEQTVQTIPPAVQEPIYESADQLTQTLQSNITTYIQNIGTFLLNSMLQVVNTVTFLLGFVIVPFWLFYVIKDQHAGLTLINRMLSERIRADFWAVFTIIDRVFSSYIRGQLLLGFVVGTMAGVGLLILNMFGLNVDFILILAIIAGITELIPIIGPVIGAIPAVILGFFDSPTTGIAVLILYSGIQQLENNILVPRIIGDSVGIHPAILMVLLVILGQVFGLLGVILSAPVAAVFRDIFVYTHGRLDDPPRPAGALPDRSPYNST